MTPSSEKRCPTCGLPDGHVPECDDSFHNPVPESLPEQGTDLKGRSGDKEDGCPPTATGRGDESGLNLYYSTGSTPVSPAPDPTPVEGEERWTLSTTHRGGLVSVSGPRIGPNEEIEVVPASRLQQVERERDALEEGCAELGESWDRARAREAKLREAMNEARRRLTYIDGKKRPRWAERCMAADDVLGKALSSPDSEEA